MTMKKWSAPQPFREHIEGLFEFFRHRVGLGEYAIEFNYVEKIPMAGYEPGAAMQIDVDSTYLILEVDVAKKVYNESFRVGNWRGLAKVVLHELVARAHRALLRDVRPARGHANAPHPARPKRAADGAHNQRYSRVRPGGRLPETMTTYTCQRCGARCPVSYRDPKTGDVMCESCYLEDDSV